MFCSAGGGSQETHTRPVALSVLSTIVTMTSDAKIGYQSFGSFMVDEHVESMVARAASSDYVGPSPPFPTADLVDGVDRRMQLGKGVRHLFIIDFQKWTYINHGAFGGVCKPAFDEAARWREHCETQPLRFLDRELFPQLVRVMREMADFMGASPKDLALMPNATSGLNVVIKSCGLGPGDALYLLDIGYGSVKKMAQAAAAVSSKAAAIEGPEVVMGKVQFPIRRDEDIVSLVDRTMPHNTKLAVFDAVTSNTAVVLPIADLVKLCRQRGIPVLIDAAHALGQLPVDLNGLGADFYVTNCHKWLAGPRGTALMWVHPDKQSSIRPLVVSHGSGSGFTSDFIWDGCRDYAPYLGLSTAVKMWQALGVVRCQKYCSDLLESAVQLLTKAWQSSTLVPLSMCANMALVGLPKGLALAASAAQSNPEEDPSGADESNTDAAQVHSDQPLAGPSTSADAKLVQDLLHTRHSIECPIKCIQGVLFARISVAIYNDLEDYQHLCNAVLDMLKAMPLVNS